MMDAAFEQLPGLVFLAVLWWLFIWQYRKDPRRLGLAVLLLPLVLSAFRRRLACSPACFPDSGSCSPSSWC